MAEPPLTLKAVLLGLVIVQALKVKVPLELLMATLALPPLRVVWPMLYVPLAWSNTNPVPVVAVITSLPAVVGWKFITPVCPPVTDRAAALLAFCTIWPVKSTFTEPPATLTAAPVELLIVPPATVSGPPLTFDN